jgi:hypothetical protein
MKRDPNVLARLCRVETARTGNPETAELLRRMADEYEAELARIPVRPAEA